MAKRKEFSVGDKFNRLTILGEIEKRYNQRFVSARCDCGSIGEYMLSALRRGAIKSCGCIMIKYPPVKVGDVFGRLTVVEVTDTRSVGMVKVICACGIEKDVQINRLNIGKTTSCGCYHLEQTANLNKTHGLYKHKLHGVWSDIKKRCFNPNCAKFRYYGGNPTGPVIMCDEWLNSFQAFYDWAIANGWKEGLEIDKDKIWEEKHGTYPGKEYSPEYCCFLTKSENCRNRTTSNIIEYNGEKKSLTEWSEQFGIKTQLLSDRLFGLNMTPEEAFNKPVKNNSYKHK